METLLEAQKNHFRNRNNGMVRYRRPMPPTVFQPWPTSDPRKALRPKSVLRGRRGVKRTFRSSFNTSLPVEPVENKKARADNECLCCQKKNATVAIDLTNDDTMDMDLSMANTTVLTEASFKSDGSALERPTSELSFSKGLEKSANAGEHCLL